MAFLKGTFMRALNGLYRLDDLLIVQRRAAADTVPGEHEFKHDIWIDVMPKQVSAEGRDRCIVSVRHRH